MKRCTDSLEACALGALILALVTAGCSDSREDVRVTLCKDMVITQLAPLQSVTWKEARTETRGYEYAAAKLQFSTPSGEGQAVCYYNYNTVDETALTISDPLSAYSTSPFKMTLNGETLSKPALARAIKNAMLKQGRELLDNFKK